MADNLQISREFACLDAMRTARVAFLDQLVSHAQKHLAERTAPGQKPKEAPADVLRTDNTFQIAEFYYLIETFGLNDPQRISAYIDRHNEDMSALLAERDKMRRLGLLPQRITEAIFSVEQKAKVVENASGGRLKLDQSDLGRLLSTVISPETCRKTVVALADSGLIERRNIGQVLVISTGVLETYYRLHLRHIVDAILKVQG